MRIELLGSLLLEQHKDGQALSEAAEAVRLDPTIAQNHWLYGRLLEISGRRAEAEREFAAAGQLGRAGEQQLQILAAQLPDQAVIRVDDRVGQVALALLQLQHLFLDRVLGDQAIGEDLAGLADAVGAVDRLRLDGRIPPRIEQEDVFGGGEVQAKAAGLEADEEQLQLDRSGSARPASGGRGCGRRGIRRRPSPCPVGCGRWTGSW